MSLNASDALRIMAEESTIEPIATDSLRLADIATLQRRRDG